MAARKAQIQGVVAQASDRGLKLEYLLVQGATADQLQGRCDRQGCQRLRQLNQLGQRQVLRPVRVDHQSERQRRVQGVERSTGGHSQRTTNLRLHRQRRQVTAGFDGDGAPERARPARDLRQLAATLYGQRPLPVKLDRSGDLPFAQVGGAQLKPAEMQLIPHPLAAAELQGIDLARRPVQVPARPLQHQFIHP